jgi:hypothetical protein
VSLRRVAGVAATLALAAGAAALAPSCNDGSGLLRAKVIEHRSELIGGPGAMADIGDFLLENEEIRVAILGPINSPGPAPYGGSLVDADRRRPWMGYEGGNGLDRFVEAFPLSNLLVPEPDDTEVFVLEDGSNGKEAIIRVQAEGGFFLEALGVLRSQQALLEVFFPNVRTAVHFTTDYILRPGAKHVLMRTTLRLGDDAPPGCPLVSSCPSECEWGYSETTDGCLSCECSERLPLEQPAGPMPVLRNILGDPVGEPDAELKAGIAAGDFVFFGNRNDIFAPGPGFDEGYEVHKAFDEGRNTFQDPLSYDYVAATGDVVSYAYFTVARPGDPPSRVNVPLITSGTTAFISAFKSCLLDASDDATCDRNRTYVYDRYLAIGDGDVASALEDMYLLRGTPTGEIRGNVLWQETNAPVPNAQVVVFSDPQPGRGWTTVEELVNANVAVRGDFGVVNSIDADLGLDRVEDGDFRAQLPPGAYVLVAQTPEGTAVGTPISVQLDAGEEEVVLPTLPTPATLAYRVADTAGRLLPAKVMVVRRDAPGLPFEQDTLRRPYMGHGRLGNQRQHQVVTPSGQGELQVLPGTYDVIVSRGFEYGLHVERGLELRSGGVVQVDALLHREVDTTGWMSIDTHLHAIPSFDAGMPVDVRIATAASEGLEFAVATDHDVRTNYQPYARQLGLEPFVATTVGEETTTLEMGHFIGFPLVYDQRDLPGHGATDWTCMSLTDLFAEIRQSGDEIDPLTVVAHPRDGFLGYMSQLGVDTYTMNRELTLFEQNNPVFRTASCDFDAMEVLNAKRFELLRTPSVAEVVDYNRCLTRLNGLTTRAELDGYECPELAPGAPAVCRADESDRDCAARLRTAVTWLTLKRILRRTPAEQDRNWNFQGNAEDSKALCDLRALGDDPVPPENLDAPCTYRPGHVDEYFRLIERGMTPTQLAGSDAHGWDLDPGFPRAYFRSSTDDPRAITVDEVVGVLRAGHAFASYGPFVTGSIRDKTYGEVVDATAGEELRLNLEVQTASWFAADRVEVYLNGLLVWDMDTGKPPEAIVDLKGAVPFTVPARDSWVVIIALGLEDPSLMSPVYLDVPFGYLDLSRIASDAFSRVPMIDTIFPTPPAEASWGPSPAYAVTNPIYIDVDGNGRFDSPLPFPDFCSRPCDPYASNPGQCPTGQTCLEDERKCGFAITGRCRRYPRARFTHPGP